MAAADTAEVLAAGLRVGKLPTDSLFVDELAAIRAELLELCGLLGRERLDSLDEVRQAWQQHSERISCQSLIDQMKCADPTVLSDIANAINDRVATGTNITDAFSALVRLLRSSRTLTLEELDNATAEVELRFGRRTALAASTGRLTLGSRNDGANNCAAAGATNDVKAIAAESAAQLVEPIEAATNPRIAPTAVPVHGSAISSSDSEPAIITEAVPAVVSDVERSRIVPHVPEPSQFKLVRSPSGKLRIRAIDGDRAAFVRRFIGDPRIRSRGPFLPSEPERPFEACGSGPQLLPHEETRDPHSREDEPDRTVGLFSPSFKPFSLNQPPVSSVDDTSTASLTGAALEVGEVTNADKRASEFLASAKPNSPLPLSEHVRSLEMPEARVDGGTSLTVSTTGLATSDDIVVALQLLTQSPSTAYHLLAAREGLASGVPTMPIPSWVFRLTSLSLALKRGAGYAAEALRDELDFAYQIMSDSNASIARPTAALVAAASIEPAFGASNTAATSVMRLLDLGTPISELLKAIAALGDQLRGVDIRAVKANRSIQVWTHERQALRSKARDWIEEVERRSGGHLFLGARKILRQWLRPDSFIGKWIYALASASDLPESLSTLDEFARTDLAEINRQIDLTDVDQKGKRNWVDGQARRVLVETAENAIYLLREWLTLSRAFPQTTNNVELQIERALPELHRLLNSSRLVLDELVASADPVVSLAFGYFRHVLTDFESRITGRDISDQDLAERFGTNAQTSSEYLGRDLLFSNVELDEQWQPVGPVALTYENLLAFAREPTFDVKTAVERKIASFDFFNAQRLLDVCIPTTPGIEVLQGELARRISDSEKQLESRLSIAKRDLELNFRDGLLTEDERAAIVAEFSWIEQTDSSKARISRRAAALSSIEEALTRQRTQCRTELLGELERDAMKGMPADSSERIRSLIEAGQFLVARDYLSRISDDGVLPEAAEQSIDYFSDFFPTKAADIASRLTDNNESRTWLGTVQRVPSTAPVSIASLAPAERDQAVALLRLWFTRKANVPSLDASHVERIMSFLGFESPRASLDDSDSDARRVYKVKCSPIDDRERVPLSLYGSDAAGTYTVICHTATTSLGAESSGIRPAIHFVQGIVSEAKRRELAISARRNRLQYVVLDDLLLAYLASISGDRLAAFFSCALPFTGIQPYTAQSSYVAPEMFYGRAREIDAIIDPGGACLLYGGRQLGKTALLRRVVAIHHNPEDGRGVWWLDLKNELQSDGNALLARILSELRNLGAISNKRSWNTRMEDDLLSWFAAEPSRQILFLLDEADDFLTTEGESGFLFIGKLKSLIDRSQRRFKVVFAGLHNVARFTKTPNHPLAHLGRPLNIGPLMGPDASRDAVALIEKPLRALGYRFEKDSVFGILLQANYYPNLLQLWGRHLLEHLYNKSRTNQLSLGPPYVIDRQIIDETYGEKRDLREQLKEKFKFTLQLDSRYEVIAFALRHSVDEDSSVVSSGVKGSDLLDSVRSFWPEGFEDMSRSDFMVYLDEMEGLGVLRLIQDDRYTFRNPNVSRLMGSADDVISVLLETRSVPARDPNMFRKSFGNFRSPFTTIQLKQIYGTSPGVVFVIGSCAFGADRVFDCLTREFVKCYDARECADTMQYERLCTSIDFSAESSMVYCGVDVAWSAAWVERALAISRRSKSSRSVRYVFVLGPKETFNHLDELDNFEMRGVTVVQLERWKEGTIASWLEDAAIALPPGRVQELAELTGRVPYLLEQYSRIDSSTAFEALTQFRELRRRPDFIESYYEVLGLNQVDEFGAVLLREMASYKDPCTYGEIATLVGCDPENRIEMRKINETLRWACRMELVTQPSATSWAIRIDLLDVISRPNQV